MIKLESATQTRLNILPYLALFIGLFGLGLSAILVKWANAPGVVSAFYRMAIATAVMTIPFSVQIKRSGPLKRSHILWAVLAGFFFACDLGTWHPAALMTSAANAALFGNLSAVWVGLAALILFKEKLRSKFWTGLLSALVGATMIIGEDFYTHITLGTGSVLATIASFFYAGFLIATQRAREGLSSLTSWWISAVSSTVVLLIATILVAQPFTGYSITTYLNLIVLALMTQVISYILLNYALGHLPAHIVSPTLLGQPVLTAVMAVPMLGETLTTVQIIGGGIVLLGIWLVNQSR